MNRVLSLLSVLLIFTSCTNMKRVFINEKLEFIEKNKGHKIETFTEESINSLPEPLKKYLRVCGYINFFPYNIFDKPNYIISYFCGIILVGIF
jgi:hypothetical protein